MFNCISGYDINNKPIYTQVAMKLVHANCPKTNQLCSSFSRAYLPAISVCEQRYAYVKTS